MVREVIKGEKRHIAMEVERRVAVDFVINSVTYKVINKNDEIIQEGAGDIDEKIVYFLFDSTSDDVVIGDRYTAYFNITIIGSDKILKGKVSIRVIK